MTPTPDKFLIWSNEHRAWWGPNHRGYVASVEHAGQYTEEEAVKICNGANWGWDVENNPHELPVPEGIARKLKKGERP